ncbi:TniB family NTP-binding protein [Pandoraea sputorum]|uniref:TniB family NTP-binding protein n=1 Tax=Pandoraea sputorum TaxID=93222 RepID=UPI002AF6AA93|nr:TniB family NTP-binding protein [Pandoraea sputorum]
MMESADHETLGLFDNVESRHLGDSGASLQGEALRQHILTTTPQQRAEYMRMVSVNVDGFRKGLDFAEHLIRRSERTSCPGGLWVIGDGGVGKSFIIDALHTRHAPVETPLARYCPVLRLRFASRPAESEIILGLLLQLGQDPATLHYQRNADLEQYLLDALPVCQTLAILFDEANHLWLNVQAKRTADRLGGRLGDFLKRFYDKSGLAFIFAGTNGLQNILEGDSQASTRWSGVLRLSPFAYDESFIGVLAALDEAMPMREPSGLATEALAHRLFEASNGNFRLLKNLLSEAVFLAAVDDAPSVSQAHLARAHFMTFCSDASPFDAS